MLGSLFVPAQRETAAGISYGFGTPSLRVSPSLYAFPDAAETRAGARTLLPGVLVEKEGRNGLFLLGELGWSGALAAAAEAAYDTPANRVRVRLRHQPFALPALSIGHPQGSFGDLSWSGRAGRRLGLTVSGAAARYDDPRAPQRTAGGSADVAWSISRHWSARAGVSAGRYDAEGEPRVETLGETAGLAFDTGRVGLSALYRYQTNSATNRGGPGGHVAGHVGGRFRLSAYADYQRDAPTLSILLADYPGCGASARGAGARGAHSGGHRAAPRRPRAPAGRRRPGRGPSDPRPLAAAGCRRPHVVGRTHAGAPARAGQPYRDHLRDAGDPARHAVPHPGLRRRRS